MRILRPAGVAPAHVEALRIACVSLYRMFAGVARPASVLEIMEGSPWLFACLHHSTV